MCLLLRSEILGLLANKLTVADKYSRNYREIFLRPIQKLLSKKPKLSSEFFITSLKSSQNSQFFEKKKDENHTLYICDIMDSDTGGFLSKSSCLRTPFGSQRVIGF